MKFRDLIVNSIANLPEGKNIYVLKGFNFWTDIIKGNYFFEHIKYIDTSLDINALTDKLSKGCSYLVLHEELSWLQSNSLLGVLIINGYNIKIIENDLFNNYYPDRITNETTEIIKQLESTEDNKYQKLYGDYVIYNEKVFLAYTDLYDFQGEILKLTELLPQRIKLELSPNSIEIPDEYDEITFSDILTRIVEDNFGKINVLKNKIDQDNNIFRLKKILEPFGYEFTTRDFNIKEQTIDSDDLKAWESILKRKNASYTFRDIKIYSDPYDSVNLIDVNQSQIINDIVENSKLAYSSENFRDIFVTSPTGSGKSILFQIPAIYLAENYNLLTIIVSPLIGLMNDQVENIKMMTKCAGVINSDYTPAQKEETLEKVKNGDISILYLSPESLLSNYDITNLIGDRKIGLLVVDEAHIVATWGKSFRPDYWYLGEYVDRLRNKNKSDYRFPIATFTATATFGGDDNMYQDIIESLNMTPIKYIGNVKRDNISFDIRKQTEDHAYKEEKLQIATESINQLSDKPEKTLVYFPYKRQIEDIYSKVKDPQKFGKYFGSLAVSEKHNTVNCIKNGTKNVVLATKAFGMGIDIDDIKNVYHFAPTGNITDYVQEIGRAARKTEMVGNAITDYYVEDFRYIKQLHGLSSIKNFQVIAVLKKIYLLYRKYNTRNFLVSPDEFSHIFTNCELDEVDAKLKATLLVIKKDFELDNSLNYVPIVIKPRSLFTSSYFMVNDDFISTLKQVDLFKYFEALNLPREQIEYTSSPFQVSRMLTNRMPGDTYSLDMKNLWESKYKDMSFGKFKSDFFKRSLPDFDFRLGEKVLKRIIIQISPFANMKNTFEELNIRLYTIKQILDNLKQKDKHFSIQEFANEIFKTGITTKKHVADLISETILPLVNNMNKGKLFSRNFYDYNSDTDKYSFRNHTYENKIEQILITSKPYLSNPNVQNIVLYASDEKGSAEIIIAQLLELFELADCQISSGTNPEFFIRVNNPYAIDKIINNPYYLSRTVKLISDKHIESCQLMQHFFEKLSTDKERWDFIEKYFLGKLTEIS